MFWQWAGRACGASAPDSEAGTLTHLLQYQCIVYCVLEAGFLVNTTDIHANCFFFFPPLEWAHRFAQVPQYTVHFSF